MSEDVKVIWKKGDAEMPAKARHVVEAAQGELLFKALQLPDEVVDTIKYNADKNAKTVNGYVTGIVMERVRAAS